MTVAKLIEQLQDMDADNEVLVQLAPDGGPCVPLMDVTERERVITYRLGCLVSGTQRVARTRWSTILVPWKDGQP